MNRKVLVGGLLVTLPLVALLVTSLGRDPHKVDFAARRPRRAAVRAARHRQRRDGGAQCEAITAKVGGLDRLLQLTGNQVLPGFTAPKIVWVRENEPGVYERTTHILLPKDYVRFRLTGEFATEVSDASGMLLLDVARRRWSQAMLQALDIPEAWLPICTESDQVSGRISETAAQATDLKAGTPVVGGGGDQAAQAVGSGIVQAGVISVTSGTSGVVFAHSDQYAFEAQGRLHAFCHAVPGKWHFMGVPGRDGVRGADSPHDGVAGCGFAPAAHR